MVVLGLDPGSVRIGYGLIESEGGQLTYLEGGLLKVSSLEEKRLAVLEKNLVEILNRFRPSVAGVEKLFFVKNQKTALRVSETRGVLLNALFKKNIAVVEISPSEVKIALTGNGQAPKSAVAKMVGYFLRLPPQKLIDDITDALAIAIAVSRRQLKSGH